MAEPHKNSSFSYKSINKNIRQILETRSELDNTIQLAMPFIKATTTVRLPDYLNGPNNLGFTLGLHAIEEDVTAENIYSTQDGDSLIGYTYTPDGTTERVYAKNTTLATLAGKFFDGSTQLYGTTKSNLVPPPGITSATVGRNKNGLLVSADIKLSIPSLLQLEILHRTFLIPGVGMVLEWGQQFSNEISPSLGEFGLSTTTNLREKMFPWYDRQKLLPLLYRLGRNQVGIQEILDKYVYPTQGQYMWMFGRVANFNVQSNSDGSFEASVKIVGPSEDAWAFSTRNTVIPPRDRRDKVCTEFSNSIESYFTSTSTGLNLKSLLERVASSPSHPWHGHVYKFTQGNKSEGEVPPQDITKPNISEDTFADSEDAYFMTWRFFVNVVLNSQTEGVKAIFKNATLTDDELRKISTLRPYSDKNTTPPDRMGLSQFRRSIDDKYENFVGNNPFLRSTDLSTLIIVNEKAATLADQDLSRSRPQLRSELTNAESAAVRQMRSIGDFYYSAESFNTNTESDRSLNSERYFDKGFLSTGVWINHKAVVQSLAASETLLGGILNLLDRMNSATMNFWELTIDESQPFGDEETSLDYTVIDANYRENSNYAVANFLEGDKRVHVFNRYIRKTTDNKLLGSDVIECNVDLALPKRLFTQIAITGLVSPRDAELAISGSGDTLATENPLLSDPNDALREMFAITSLNPKDDTQQGPDVTIPSKIQRQLLLENTTCGKANSQTTAGAGGLGVRVSSINSVDGMNPQVDVVTIEKYTKILNSEPCTTTCSETIQNVPETNSRITDNTVTYIANTGQSVSVPIQKNTPPRLPAAKTLYDNGYRNGQLSPTILQSVGGSDYLYREVAEKYLEMVTEARRNQVVITLRDSYRPLEEQISLITTRGWASGPPVQGGNVRFSKGQPRGFAATPGTSNHGWGIAVDINIPDQTSATYQWLKTNARRYGFAETVEGEPWHWEYERALTKPVQSPGPAQIQTPTTPNVLDSTNQFTRPTTVNCTPCIQARDILRQVQVQRQDADEKKSVVDKLVKEYGYLKEIFRYMEPFPEAMVTNIAKSSNGDLSNAFGAAPSSLSIKANLTLPGINGLRVGELFWIDRIPAFYRAFGAFQILSIEDVISLSGWQTKINSHFNYLGGAWKRAMAEKLQRATR